MAGAPAAVRGRGGILNRPLVSATVMARFCHDHVVQTSRSRCKKRIFFKEM
jgi:hypothetical protein